MAIPYNTAPPILRTRGQHSNEVFPSRAELTILTISDHFPAGAGIGEAFAEPSGTGGETIWSSFAGPGPRVGADPAQIAEAFTAVKNAAISISAHGAPFALM